MPDGIITILDEVDKSELETQIEDHTSTDHIKTYTDIGQIGLTAGSETIESIATSLPNSSRLMYTVTDTNAAIYPYTYGTLIVDKANVSRVTFQFYRKDSSQFWVGMCTIDDSTTWFGWSLVYGEHSKPTPEDIGAVDKNGDTMTGILNFQKYDNGSGWIQKNHSTSADYGTQIRDESASEKVAMLAVCGAEQRVTVTLRDGPDASAVAYTVYHTGNKPTASEITPGTFSGKMVAQYTASSDIESSQLRNIYAGTSGMTAGTTRLNPGYIYLQYK